VHSDEEESKPFAQLYGTTTLWEATASQRMVPVTPAAGAMPPPMQSQPELSTLVHNSLLVHSKKYGEITPEALLPPSCP
jgi:hypothetical protein